MDHPRPPGSFQGLSGYFVKCSFSEDYFLYKDRDAALGFDLPLEKVSFDRAYFECPEELLEVGNYNEIVFEVDGQEMKVWTDLNGNILGLDSVQFRDVYYSFKKRHNVTPPKSKRIHLP